MLYGRLDEDTNTILEIISIDPAGRYPEEMVWINIPDDFGLLTTKSKNQLLREIQQVQAEVNSVDIAALTKQGQMITQRESALAIEREKLEANGIDVDAVWQTSIAPPAEEESEESEESSE
jgi:hypothetical protein